MKSLESIVPLILIAVGAFLLYFPIYLILFIPRRLKAKKIGPGAGPSILTLVLCFLVVLVMFAVAVPNFLQFAAKSKQSEAKQNLGAIFTCQVAYFGEENTYGGGPDAFDLINWAPEGRNMYAYYCGGDMFENKKGYKHKQIKPGPDWPYRVRPGASGTGFTCMAVGDIDSDDFRDVWTINNAKVLANVENDVHNSYNYNPPGSPFTPLIFFSLLLLGLFLSFWRDGKNRKQALAKFKKEEAKKSGAEANEESSEP